MWVVSLIFRASIADSFPLIKSVEFYKNIIHRMWLSTSRVGLPVIMIVFLPVDDIPFSRSKSMIISSYISIDRILYYPSRLHLKAIHREEIIGWRLNDWIFSAREFEHSWHVQHFWIYVVYIYLVEIPPLFFRICNQLSPRVSVTWL